MTEELTAVRLGRNYLRVGDICRVRPSRPHKRDGFESRVRRITRTRSGASNGGIVTVLIERIERRVQAKNPEQALRHPGPDARSPDDQAVVVVDVVDAASSR